MPSRYDQKIATPPSSSILSAKVSHAIRGRRRRIALRGSKKMGRAEAIMLSTEREEGMMERMGVVVGLCFAARKRDVFWGKRLLGSVFGQGTEVSRAW